MNEGPQGPSPGPRLVQRRSLIEGRAAGGWVVEGRLYRPALLITATIARSVDATTPEALDASLLDGLAGIDLLLLGTGAMLRHAPGAFAAAAQTHAIRIEPMDSGAAARTFNVLASEGRSVAALILPDGR